MSAKNSPYMVPLHSAHPTAPSNAPTLHGTRSPPDVPGCLQTPQTGFRDVSELHQPHNGTDNTNKYAPPPLPAPPQAGQWYPQLYSHGYPHHGPLQPQPEFPAHEQSGHGPLPSASTPNCNPHVTVKVNTGTTPSSSAPGSSEGTLQLPPVGFFKDLLDRIEAVPAERVVGMDQAAIRVVTLKHKLNELQKKRESYHMRQAGNAGVAAASAIFTAGTSLLLQGPAALHQRNRLQQILRAMREVIVQINTIRAEFGAYPGWDGKDGSVQICNKVFTKGLKRGELYGRL